MSAFMDLELSRRLERAEGSIATSFVAVQQSWAPERKATWREFDGTFAIFDGRDSPMTQTFGLGLFNPVTAELLVAIEAFFNEAGADAMHEVSPLAGVETFAMLSDRGYRVSELGTMLVQELSDGPVEPTTVTELGIRVIEPADRDVWIETSVAGWSDDQAFASVIRSMAEVACENRSMVHFLIDREGVPVGTASMGVHDGVAYLAGASTIPAARRLGAQTMLLAARLAEARTRGCSMAMMITTPGSTSQRNAERRGFRVAYTRTKWRKARP